MNTIGTVQAHLVTDQLSEYSADTIGWIFGLYSFISFFGGIQIGALRRVLSLSLSLKLAAS